MIKSMFIGVAAGVVALSVLGASGATLADDSLAQRFVTRSAEARPWCYWYWMNGNVTREGIQADMQGFADVGVGGVMLFDIGIHPAGTVTNRSPEWYDLVKFATSEAARHGIKMSFHCPGWSASGGPWITPERGMQELTWSETVIDGPRLYSGVLRQPLTRMGYYRDAAVLAFPALPGDAPLAKPQFQDVDGKPLPAGAEVMDRDTASVADLPDEFDLVYPEPVQVRSIFVRGARASGGFNVQLSAWDAEKGAFRNVAKFRSHTSGPFSANIGSASFEPVKASQFRFDFGARKRGERIVLEQLMIGGGFRVTDWTSKAGFATERIVPRPNDLQPQPSDIIVPERIMDLTDKMAADGTLSWAVPPGRWTVLRIGQTPTGVHISPPPLGGVGLECDKLSREAADFHYDKCVTPVLKDLGPELVKKTMAYYHVDSYEAGWQNWTKKFPQDFRARRGYDLTRYLPALTGRVVGDLATTERFLWDFRRTIGDLFADNHYGRLAERSHADGLGFSTEPYGGPFESLQVGGRADHPMVEFWLPTKPQGPKVAFHGVFAGHTTERSIIGAESFTAEPPMERWNSHPFSLKALGDYIYCSGVNRFVIHTSAHQPLIGEHFMPGFTCGCNGIHFDRGNTWWRHGAKEWVDYLTRCQSLLQAGEPVDDVLYFQGNDSPDGVGPYNPALPEGYDFDACNSEVLANLRVKDGRILLPHGKAYRYLVLPHDGLVTLASLEKLAALAAGGTRLVGTVPKESPSLADAPRRDEYVRVAGNLAGRISTNQSFAAILADDKLAPDFDYAKDSGLKLHATHRRIGEADVYFVASATTGQTARAECRFRVAGKVPELWDAATGQMRHAAEYRTEDGVTIVPLQFDPSGSIFVVFRNLECGGLTPLSLQRGSTRCPPGEPMGANAASLTARQAAPDKAASSRRTPKNWSEFTKRLEIAGPWEVAFPAGWGAPPKITLRKLISWPDHSDTGVKYFSGTAAYRKVFVLPDVIGYSLSVLGKTNNQQPITHNQPRMWLDLGHVEVIAEVWLNGKSLGTLWKPPFRVDVTEAIKTGKNDLEVHVTNLWPNRLTGDEQYPDDLTTNGPWTGGGIRAWPNWLKKGEPRPEPRRLTFFTWKHRQKDNPLLPSGLLGPVTLQGVE